MHSTSSAKRLVAGAVAVGLGSLLLPPAAWAGLEDKEPISYTISGATVRGFYKVAVEAINGIVRDTYPGSAATFRPAPPVGGVQAVGEGKADFAIAVSALEIQFAVEGKKPYPNSLKGKLCHVMVFNEQQTFTPVMLKSWAEKNGINSFADIAAKKPAMHVHINTLANIQASLGMAEAGMNAGGFGAEDITKWGGSIFRGNSGRGLDALVDGKVQVYLNGGFFFDPRLEDVAKKRPIVWIESDPEKLRAEVAKWNYKVKVVPKSLYSFLDKDQPTIVQWSSILSRPTVKDEVVYKFVKALHTNAKRIHQINPALKEFSGKVMAENPTPLPYCNGAQRYYQENRLL
ncbi:MAG: TAXI family TRAP transporter solute-binding subunit [Alphaproteobacteria bacterium]